MTTPDITTLALLNLIRPLSAELVAGEHRDDVTKPIEAMDRHLNSTPLPRGTDINDARAGIAQAKELLRPYVAHVRDRAEAVRVREEAKTSKLGEHLPMVATSKYLFTSSPQNVRANSLAMPALIC